MAPKQHRLHGTTYVVTLLALLGLTAGSFGLSQLDLGRMGTAVALVIATIKVTAVLLVFMHLIEASFSMRVVALISLIFVVLLCLGVAADVAVR